MHAIMYSTEHCGWCKLAKELLATNDIPFDVRMIGEGYTKEDMQAHVGKPVTSVPQIFIDGEYVGGFTDLAARFD